MKIVSQSLSLSVKDIALSKTFYITLGYEPLEGAGSIEDKWMILVNGHMKIGLFQDMFDDNLITINPVDARSLYATLLDHGAEVVMASDSIQNESGPCHFMVKDPDGNIILFDQHE